MTVVRAGVRRGRVRPTVNSAKMQEITVGKLKDKVYT